jgi:hypothetical protein
MLAQSLVVNSSGNKIRWPDVFRLLIWAGLVIYVFSRFIPCATVNDYPKSDGLDDAWTQALHLAFAQHWQFGTDLVFTYGPWGFLARGYYPPTYLIAVLAWTVLSVVFICAGWRLARHFFKNELVAAIWLVAFTAATSIPAGEDFNNRLVAWSVLLLFLNFFIEEKIFTPIQAALAISLGWMSLVKFTGLTESAVVVGVIALDNIFRQRRFPWVLPTWVASVLFFWFAAGQHFASLKPFLFNSWEITSGYTEAMMLAGETETRDTIGFLLIAGLLCTLIGRLAWARHRYFGLLPLAGMAMILFIVFKLGFVRNGWQHATTSALALMLVALAGLAIAQSCGKIIVGIATGSLVIALMFSVTVFNFWLPGDGFGKQVAGTFSLENLFAPVAAVCTGHLRDDYEKNLADGRKDFSLPPVVGVADIYSFDQNILFANELSYQPRPVIQSYSAYTPALAELNAAHLRGAYAASNILFTVQTIDGRFPALDDGLSWPELLTRYDCKGAADKSGKFLLFTRSPMPRKFELAPLQNFSARFGESVTLPTMTSDPIWVEIEIKKTFAGKVLATFYKPPTLRIVVMLKNRAQKNFRLIPGLAAGGFLLSPLVADTKSFAALADGRWRKDLAGAEVVSVVISADTKSGSTICYQSPMAIRFYELKN